MPAVVVQDDDDVIVALLRKLQLIVLEHPEASRAAFSALVAEGRRFAQTESGARWRARLRGSALLNRAGLVWQTATMNLLDSDGTALPSSFIDAITMAASGPDRDALLARLFGASTGEAEEP
ncbi:MAG TPA: hypothetical protein VIF57_06680 [Polyangia bacterium]